MLRADVLGRGRIAAEASMRDTCTIRRASGETEGPGGVVTPTWTQVYTGRCRVQIRAEQGTTTEVGEAALILERREVQLPLTAVGLAEGDEITITAAAFDPDLVGRVYRIRDVITKSEATARRVTVIEVTS